MYICVFECIFRVSLSVGVVLALLRHCSVEVYSTPSSIQQQQNNSFYINKKAAPHRHNKKTKSTYRAALFCIYAYDSLAAVTKLDTVALGGAAASVLLCLLFC